MPDQYPSREGDRFGMFLVPKPDNKRKFFSVIFDDGDKTGWEHASFKIVKGHGRKLYVLRSIPGWDECCYVKNLFWKEGECVVQFHPAKENYVNIHPFVLHLWKLRDGTFPTPPIELV